MKRLFIRSLLLAILTLFLAFSLAVPWFRVFLFAFTPGYVVAWHFTSDEVTGTIALIGVNFVVWWLGWFIVLFTTTKLRVYILHGTWHEKTTIGGSPP